MRNEIENTKCKFLIIALKNDESLSVLFYFSTVWHFFREPSLN